MNTYKEFTIKAEPFNSEILSSVLWSLNIIGLLEDNELIKIYCKPGELSRSDIEEKLNNLIKEKILDKFDIQENEFEEKNWNEEWENSLNVIEVSDKLVIKPSFREYESKPDQVILTIDPKMSFGTGEHQTTKLMLLMIEKYVKPGIKVLDVGTGTGVLAIASVKLGADQALAIDNDEWCLDNGIENCRINSAADKVEIKTATIDQIAEKDFDLVLANIHKSILIEIAEGIELKTIKNGILILSGLLREDENDIVDKYSACKFKLIDKRYMDEWITLVFQKIS